MNKQEYIESVNAAKQHSYEYYVLSRPTISDAQFDALVSRIEQAEHEHPEWTLPDSPTQCVGSDLSGNGKRLVRHRTPMLSCQKAQTTDAVEKWLEKVKKKLGYVPEVMLSWKADGISCSLVYQNGCLISAATRGDGRDGSDLLDHVKVMGSVPKEIPMKGRIEVRGEIVCPKANLNKMAESYSDCRSAASGICGKNYVSGDCKLLEFWAWDVIADGEKFCWQRDIFWVLRDLGFEKNCYSETDNGQHLAAMLNEKGELRDKTTIPVDGIVIRIDSNQVFASQGFTDHHPKGSIAYKFPPTKTTTRVRRIEISIGATGRRTPVAWLEPVTILGRTIEKASLGSEAKMDELGVTDGCTVEIGLSNDVTPKIYRVLAA